MRSNQSKPGDDPLLKSRLKLSIGGKTLRLLAPRSGFASGSIDPGTRLLLEHLPPRVPGSFLDLGCGYGALGLAAAALHPRARGLLVDRDLLAVEFSRRNALENGLGGVTAAASLGFRDIDPGWGPFDWVLANLPARVGDRVIGALLLGGARRLAPGGEMRVVIIAPLAAALERTARERGLECARAAATGRHVVFAIPPPRGGAAEPPGTAGDEGEVYERDVIEVPLRERKEPLRLARPTDLADEPHRLSLSIPLLDESLPAAEPARVLVFRSGYGLVAAMALARYPGAQITAVDRDLLAALFTARNCVEAGARVRIEATLAPAGAPVEGGFDLALGELSSPLGPAASLAELAAVRGALAPGGMALVLGLVKDWREYLREAAGSLGLRLVASRGPSALYGIETLE